MDKMKKSSITIRMKDITDEQMKELDENLLTLLDALGIERYFYEIEHIFGDGTYNISMK